MAMSQEQFVAMIDTLQSQVDELATSLDRSRQDIADLRNATDIALEDMQDTVEATRLAAKDDAVEADYMRLIHEKVLRPLVSDGSRKEIRGWARSVNAFFDI